MDEIRTYTAEEIQALSDEELETLHTEQQAAFDERRNAEAPTKRTLTEAQALAANLDLIAPEVDARGALDGDAAEEFAALKDRTFGVDDAAEEDEEEPEGEEPEEEPEQEPDQAEAEEEGEEPAEETPAPQAEETAAPVAAKGKTKTAAKGTVKALAARRNGGVTVKAGRKVRPVSLVAAAGAPNLEPGSKIDLTEMAQAAIDRARTFSVPNGDGGTPNLSRFPTGKIEIEFPEDIIVDRYDEESNEAAIAAATDESKLAGGSLVAAGGWCAPSETVYDLDQDATTEGMVSLPEIGIRRGGLRFAVSPTFAAFYANPGFTQTETEAIAGTTKPCVEVPCPSFTDVRMDVEGLCIKVPILTNVGYPEAVANFIAGTLVAHQHWMNANIIGRLVTAAGAARVFTGLGSVASDSLEALGLVIDQRRQKHRLGLKATVEVLVPFWVKNVFRSDIGRRTGRDKAAVSDAEINAHFATLGANVQYLYDWQAIDETAEVYPGTFNALVYPAGTFVKGVQNVINLDTVYDAASLAVNTYTGLFTEQGYLVAQKKFGADLITLPICTAGRTGAADLTCVVGP